MQLCLCAGLPAHRSQLPHLQLLEHTVVQMRTVWVCLLACAHVIPCVPCVLQLKQMKELDQEQEVLLQGLEMIARGREWYQQQLQRVQERQRRLSQSRAAAVSACRDTPDNRTQVSPDGLPLDSGRNLRGTGLPGARISS